jgi:hypothetical protein
MNDLDLRTALHRDADLVGAPSADLLEQLVQRRRDQRRRRAGMLTAGLAVAVISAGIPIGASFSTRGDGGTAHETTIGSNTPVTPETLPPAPAVTTPTSVVTAWMREQFQGLSFNVPTNDAPGGVEVTPRIVDAETPDGWARYDWNVGFTPGAPPVSILVSSARGAHPDSIPAPGSVASLPGKDNVEPRSITVPGTRKAVYWRNAYLFEDGRPPMTSVSLYLETATRSYTVVVSVPDDDDGDWVAQEFVDSLDYS